MKFRTLSLILFAITLCASAQTEKLDLTHFKGKGLSYGVPACPEPFTVTQPDGEEITLCMKGDGAVHWYETLDGYTVLKNTKGQYVYALKNANGDLVAGKTVLSSKKSTPSGNKGLRFSSDQVAKQKAAFYKKSSFKATDNPLRNFPCLGENKTICLLIDFPNIKHKYNKEDFEKLFNEDNYEGTGSVKDFYKEISYGKFDLNVDVVDWTTAEHDHTHYGAQYIDQSDGAIVYDTDPGALVREALIKADEFVDYSQYARAEGDSNYVGAVIVVHSGEGEEMGNDSDAIWSHRYRLDNPIELDGVIISDYCLMPEILKEDIMNNIGVYCHEFGHNLGLPDYYDTDGTGSGGTAFGLAHWDCMANGAWNNNASTPAGFNMFSKWLLKWSDFVVLNPLYNDYEIGNSLYTDTAFAIMKPGSTVEAGREVYFFENRQLTGFDEHLPGHGFLLFHLDLKYSVENGNAIWNDNPYHPVIDVVEADGTENKNDYAGDPFPGTTGKTLISDVTEPNILWWDESKQYARIDNIKEENGIIYFDFIKQEDVTRPTVDITSEYVGRTSANPIPIKFEFSEPVLNFNQDCLKLINANVENFSKLSELEYTADLVPISTGTINCYLHKDKVTDESYNGNEFSEYAVIYSTTSSVQDLTNLGISVYPNPVNDILTIKLGDCENTSINIYDVYGRTVYSKTTTDNSLMVNMSSYSTGTYILKIKVGNDEVVQKLLVK